MAQNGARSRFIFEAAAAGESVVAGLARFDSTRNFNDLAAQVSVIASLLRGVGIAVSDHEGFFKDNFEEKFRVVTDRCAKDFEVLRAGLDKAMSKEPVADEDDEDDKDDKDDKDGAKNGKKAKKGKKPRKLTKWKRLLAGLGMDYIDDLEDSLSESKCQVMMLQDVVSRVVLLNVGQGRPLTVPEATELQRLKKKAGWLLQTLRVANITAVIAFGISETAATANATRSVARASRIDSEDFADSKGGKSICGSSITVRNTSELDISKPVKEKPSKDEVTPTSDEFPDEFELWLSHNQCDVPSAKKNYRLLGLNLSVEQNMSDKPFMDQIAATQDEIKSFASKHGAQTTESSFTALEMMLHLPPTSSAAIGNFVRKKNKTPTFTFPARCWSIVSLTKWPAREATSRRWLGPRSPRQFKNAYAVILKGVAIKDGKGGYHRPGPPPPPGWKGPPRSIKRRDEECRDIFRNGAELELTQQEAEKVLNDFVASISILYDNIPVESRGAVMESIGSIPGVEADDGSDSDSYYSSDTDSSFADD